MAQQIEIGDEALADAGAQEDGTHEVAPDLAYQRLAIVNVGFVGVPGNPNWVLVDAGPMKSAGLIQSAAKKRFGDAPPRAIVMTHGHFDHVGSLEALLETWDVPVYVHALEAPYFRGEASYPPPDTTTGGGIMPLLSPLFPRGPVDVSKNLHLLPEDGSVPPLPGWKWLHTPGHTPGHVSLFRESDRALIAGDAFVTTKQESLLSVATQRKAVSRPPGYGTTDWAAARSSVQALAELKPSLAATGHGPVMAGAELHRELDRLVADFDLIAAPDHGRYAHTARPSS